MRESVTRYQQLTADKERFGGTKVGSAVDQAWYDAFDVDASLEMMEQVNINHFKIISKT